jgi:hypothetical protein
MYEKDFIIRLIQNFLEAIARIVNKIEEGNVAESRIEIEKTYELLGESSVFFREANFGKLLVFLNPKDNIQLKKFDLLAKLISIDAKIQSQKNLKCSMFKKAQKLWKYYNHHSKEYSFEREQQLLYIKEFIENNCEN